MYRLKLDSNDLNEHSSLSKQLLKEAYELRGLQCVGLQKTPVRLH